MALGSRGRLALAIGIAIGALAGARATREVARTDRDAWPKNLSEPWAPSPAMTPYVAMGHRELLADVLWMRVLGYFGGGHDTADGVASLVEAVQAADPHFRRVYTDGVRAMMSAHHGLEERHMIRAAQLAEKGVTYFPKDYDIADLAGEIYSVRLKSKDPAIERAWREKGAMLIEKALRMPGAPADDAAFVAYLRSTLGQHERAVRELREMVLITNDAAAKKEMIDKLAQLEKRDADAIEVALDDAKKEFTDAWHRDRPELPETMYVLLGPRPAPSFDLRALAAGRDLVDVVPEPLEPIDYDDDAGAAPGSGLQAPGP
jgi:hypothetical protein